MNNTRNEQLSSLRSLLYNFVIEACKYIDISQRNDASSATIWKNVALATGFHRNITPVFQKVFHCNMNFNACNSVLGQQLIVTLIFSRLFTLYFHLGT